MQEDKTMTRYLAHKNAKTEFWSAVLQLKLALGNDASIEALKMMKDAFPSFSHVPPSPQYIGVDDGHDIPMVRACRYDISA